MRRENKVTIPIRPKDNMPRQPYTESPPAPITVTLTQPACAQACQVQIHKSTTTELEVQPARSHKIQRELGANYPLSELSIVELSMLECRLL